MDMIEDRDTNKKGSGKNKRKWTDAEDNELVYALFNMLNAGAHKADNGFKPGFLGVIEAVLKQKLLGSRIKTKPHIDSRIKTTKKDFRVMYDMLNGENCVGFGWDPEKNVVVAEDEVSNGYVKAHKVPVNGGVEVSHIMKCFALSLGRMVPHEKELLPLKISWMN
ncbi:hypothetical protein AAC387_Pa01g2290 [Persea americana]